MTQFYREYSDMPLIGQQAVAQLSKMRQSPKGQQVVAQIPWGHNVLLMQKIKDKTSRFWYMQKTVEQGWMEIMEQALINHLVQISIHGARIKSANASRYSTHFGCRRIVNRSFIPRFLP